MRSINYFLILLTIAFYSCSASEETTQQKEKKEPDVYIFDDIQKDAVNINDTTKAIPSVEEVKVEPVKVDTVKSEQPISGKRFIIQLGAFTTKERAEAFINENKSKTELVMNIIYREQIKLFAVQLPPFATREEAEKTRNNLWQTPSFKDAFIITVE
ncbi:MAG: SPOR domain-containing protein [Ignavibacteriales bacterium]|nr:SPOR domain-containing protein [Ignavibacteriales bacterium]